MTTLKLLSTILLGLFLQLLLFAGLAFRRHWLRYRELQEWGAGFAGESPPGPPLLSRPAEEGAVHPPAWTGLREFQVVRKVFEDESRTVCSFHLAPTDGRPLPPFRPGQYLTFELSLADPATGRTEKVIRCYSLSDRPGLDHYRISIKRVPAPPDRSDLPPGMGSNHFHDAIHQGSRVKAKAPGGHFVLEPGGDPVVLVAGGIGITPLLSMLNATLESGSTREIWLFYGVRNSAEHPMKEHLERLAATHPNFRLQVCYSRPLTGDAEGRDYQHAGHVEINRLRLTLALRPYHFYICGPSALLESLVPALDEWGVPEHRIHYEAFGPSSLNRPHRQGATPPRESPSPEGATITVTFMKSGKSLPWDDSAGSLLELAERHGIRVTSGCRAGGCGTCQTEIREGTVRYIQPPDCDPPPGTCLLCIARPVGNISLSA